MFTEDEFIKIAGGIWRHIFKKTYVPVRKPKDKRKYLKNLYKKIVNYQYSPSPSREYLVSNKHNLVSRIVPILSIDDLLVYYFTVKSIEDDLSKQRIPNTFGGFSMGGEFRRAENKENEEFDLLLQEVSMSPYSYNPLAWREAWSEFQKVVSRNMVKNGYENFIIFDIANFYDSINLAILERKIRLTVRKKKSSYIDLLFYFLSGWNKKFEFYNQKTVGLPQDEVGDPSRVLANFYLQDFDKKMHNLCVANNVEFIRYSDDMIIMGEDMSVLKNILFFASKELSKINLNINSSKVKQFNSREKFGRYWAFEIFNLLADKNNVVEVEKGIDMFFDYLDKKIEFKKDSVLKRILACNIVDIDLAKKSKILSLVLDDNFLPNASEYFLERILILVDESDKAKITKKLDNLIQEVPFNTFHYTLLKFANELSLDKKKIKERIKEIRF